MKAKESRRNQLRFSAFVTRFRSISPKRFIRYKVFCLILYSWRSTLKCGKKSGRTQRRGKRLRPQGWNRKNGHKRPREPATHN